MKGREGCAAHILPELGDKFGNFEVICALMNSTLDFQSNNRLSPACNQPVWLLLPEPRIIVC